MPAKKSPVSPKKKSPVKPKKKSPVSPKKKSVGRPKKKSPVSPKKKSPVSPKKKSPVSPKKKSPVSPKKKSVGPKKKSVGPKKKSVGPKKKSVGPKKKSVGRPKKNTRTKRGYIDQKPYIDKLREQYKDKFYSLGKLFEEHIYIFDENRLHDIKENLEKFRNNHPKGQVIYAWLDDFITNNFDKINKEYENKFYEENY